VKKSLPPIYFYIPHDQNVGSLPTSAYDYWPWRRSMSKKLKFLGIYDWTLQTFLRLKDNGFRCELANSPPSRGIIIAHKDFLGEFSRPNRFTLLICLKSDRLPHSYAQIHVVQNPNDNLGGMQQEFVKSFFIPHWVQPSLIARDTARSDKFRNICYMGSEFELSEEFKKDSWEKTLKNMGLNWHCNTAANSWADYSNMDALIAIRNCSSNGEEFNFKPATKLYNSWHAGIPAILGRESAYRAERKSKFDYLEANSPEEVINALKRLRDNRYIRFQMASNGEIRARETDPEELVKKWENFLVNIACPAYHTWSSSKWRRSKYFFMSPIRKATFRIKRKILATAIKYLPSRKGLSHKTISINGY